MIKHFPFNLPIRLEQRDALTWVLLIALLSGCATTVRSGVPPRVERLQELQRGISTKADIVRSLGEPRGRGAARAPYVGYKDIMFYEYVEADSGGRVRLKFLCVFLDNDRYEGNLWFSSAGLVQAAE